MTVTLQYAARQGQIAAREVTSTPNACRLARLCLLAAKQRLRGWEKARATPGRRWTTRDRERYEWARDRAAYWAGYYAEASRIERKAA